MAFSNNDTIIYPDEFNRVPDQLKAVSAPADPAEVAEANKIRAEYHLAIALNPYMVDITRGFRLAKNASVYIEVGTQDKGNIAWLARTKLSPGCTIIDIDMEDYPENDARIKAELAGRFDYHAIRGDCLSKDVLDKVKAILAGRQADLIFCDSHYTYAHTMTEFALYFPLVRSGGNLLFHDAQWPGDAASEWEEMRKPGKGLAVVALDRHYPAYAVFGPDRPLYRFSLIPEARHWGTLAIFPKT
jgi:cephalosporin hydroxylase